MVSERTKQQAIDALNGMATIVRAEMIERGEYVSEELVNPNRVGQICGGHRACAVGSLWLGGGIKPDIEKKAGVEIWVDLPGTSPGEREDFLRPRHGLRTAYEALNDAATSYMARHHIAREYMSDWAREFDAPIESLFEDEIIGLSKKDLLGIIKSAKERVRRA